MTVGAAVVDLAFGSELIQRSLLGPNPMLGARFFGVGNELEVALAVIGLLGIGAAVATALPARTAVWGFASAASRSRSCSAGGGSEPTSARAHARRRRPWPRRVAAGRSPWRRAARDPARGPGGRAGRARAARPRHRRRCALHPLGAARGRPRRARRHRAAPGRAQLRSLGRGADRVLVAIAARRRSLWGFAPAQRCWPPTVDARAAGRRSTALWRPCSWARCPTTPDR